MIRFSDTLYGMAGNDLLLGGDGNDYLYSGYGHDTLRGDGGSDYLEGGSGNDILRGGYGNDYLNGGSGNDTLEGGYGNDTYTFSKGYGHDVIEDANGRNNVQFSGLRPKDISVRITAGQTDPARSQWVLTARESGETLTIQAQEGGKTPAVSSFDFGSTGLTPTQLLARAHHDFGADTQTTRILLKDGSVLTHTGTAGTPFQTASLQYWENNPAPTRKNGIVNPSYKQAGLSTFAKDSNGDGLIDVIDRQPQQWNVSERDLRMFASLAYENESALKTLFNGHNW